MNNFKICFGQRLKYLRKSKHFTQEKLAEHIDINLRQLARIEGGGSFITAETLQKICETLDVNPSDLFNFYNSAPVKNKHYIKLLNRLESISEDNNKIEFLTIALDSITNKNSLKKLKLLIKGLELSK